MHGKKGSGLCPVSFGVAFGLTCALAVLLWSLWVKMYGMPAMMSADHMGLATTYMGDLLRALVVLVKGFVFGFVFALLYNGMMRFSHKRCCKKSEGGAA
ncbi:MAG: hypothetical protein A3E85_06120 [Gammaproteobacteria bacterium RIFCSPHIGHO2_12_FULL_45_12]|nr:MAG: hypothetical protein A3E85_06120 [Gammaproteobacteria bacterium RIFCSPHIGHO2_12_FULL_45_12]